MSTFARVYRYPDGDETISDVGIRGSGLPAPEWQGQESAVLDLFAERAAALAPPRRLLDYGSGAGRLVVRFGDLFADVTSFEPDQDRRARQRTMLAASRLRCRVRVTSSFDPVAEAGAYDAALCSHVVQHVTVGDAEAIMSELASAVRPGGLLLVLTALTRWHGPPVRFVVGRLDTDGSLVEPELSQTEFDTVCRRNRPGELPIRFFGVDEIEAMLDRHGFAPLFSCGFHGLDGVAGPMPPGSARPPNLRACRDVAVAAVRVVDSKGG